MQMHSLPPEVGALTPGIQQQVKRPSHAASYLTHHTCMLGVGFRVMTQRNSTRCLNTVQIMAVLAPKGARACNLHEDRILRSRQHLMVI